MILKPSNIIVIFSIIAVIFIGYQTDLIQRLFGDYGIKFEKSAELPPAAAGEETSEMRMMEMAPAPSTPELQIVELQGKIKLLEYRISELEEDYQIMSESLNKKGRKFDDILALFGTFMPLIVTYVTVRNREKVDKAGTRIKTFWNKK